MNVQFKRLYPQGGSDYNIRINAMVEEADDQTNSVGKWLMVVELDASGSEDEFMELVSKLREKLNSRKEYFLKMVVELMRAFGSDELVEQASGIEGLPINKILKVLKN